MTKRVHRLPATVLPLAGACIVVTRPSDSSGAIRRRVRALGGQVVSLPGMRLYAATDASAARKALRAAQRADIAVFTSPAAVRFAYALLPGLRFSRSTRICAPGTGSARALHRRGIDDAICPPLRRDSEGLLALPVLTQVRRRRVVLIGASGGRDLLPRELRARGAQVERVEVYRRCAPRLDRRQLNALEIASLPLISLFSSADALTNLHAVVPSVLFARLAANDCVVSSARVAEVAHTLGFARVHVAASAAPADLLARARATLALHRL